MTDLDKAAHDIKLVAQRFKPLLEVAVALEEIGSLSDAVNAAQQRVEEARRLEAKAQEDLAKATHALSLQEQAVTDAASRSAGIMQDAKDKAVAIEQAAERAKSDVLAKAQESVAEAARRVAALEQEATGLTQAIDASRKELAAIKEQIKLARERIQAITG